MSNIVVEHGTRRVTEPDLRAEPSARVLPVAGQYVVALLMVTAATLIAFVVDTLVAAPNLTLIYVLPVVVAATAFGWGPSLFSAVAGVLAFDFFFTQPHFSWRMASPADIWAAALLLAVAAIVTSVAASSRRRALEARRAAEQADALQSLAHRVVEARPRAELLQAAAATLHEIFRAPAVIFLQEADGGLLRAATAGQPEIGPADEEAARGAISAGLHTRAETYPYGETEFEFWPVAASSGGACVIGLDFTRGGRERPEAPERFIAVVAAWLAVALRAGSAGGGVTSPKGGSPRLP
jgi:two-component system sensor histidine kinase KdpD